MKFTHICAALLFAVALWPAQTATAQQRLVYQDVADHEYAYQVRSRTVTSLVNSGDWQIETVYRNGSRELKGTLSVITRVLARDGTCLFGATQEVLITRQTEAFAKTQQLAIQGKIPRRLARLAARTVVAAEYIPDHVTRAPRVAGSLSIPQQINAKGACNQQRPAPQVDDAKTQANKTVVPAIQYVILP